MLKQEGPALSKSKGFTLIELLVVIAIIGIIAVLILLMLSGTRVKARDARRKSDVGEIVKAIEMYKDKYNDTLPGIAGTVYRSDTGTNWNELLTNTMYGLNREPTEKIIATLPNDPSQGTTGRGYYYYPAANGLNYEVGAAVELCVNGQNDGGNDNSQPPGNTGTVGTFYESGSDPLTLTSGGITSAGCK